MKNKNWIHKSLFPLCTQEFCAVRGLVGDFHKIICRILLLMLALFEYIVIYHVLLGSSNTFPILDEVKQAHRAV